MNTIHTKCLSHAITIQKSKKLKCGAYTTDNNHFTPPYTYPFYSRNNYNLN